MHFEGYVSRVARGPNIAGSAICSTRHPANWHGGPRNGIPPSFFKIFDLSLDRERGRTDAAPPGFTCAVSGRLRLSAVQPIVAFCAHLSAAPELATSEDAQKSKSFCRCGERSEL